MRFTNLLTAVSIASTAASGVLASAVVGKDLSLDLSVQLSLSNHYGAPHPPWESGCYPGWYYGHDGGYLGELPTLTSGVRIVISL